MTEQQDAPLLSPEPDVEGHLKGLSYGLPEDEDVEGHMRKAGSVQTEDEDDVEGHVRLGSAVQPGFDEDGSSQH